MNISYLGILSIDEMFELFKNRQVHLCESTPIENHLIVLKTDFNLLLNRIPEKEQYLDKINEDTYRIYQYFPAELSSNLHSRYGKDSFSPKGSLAIQYIRNLDDEESLFSEHNLLITHMVPYTLVLTLQELIPDANIIQDNYDVLLNNFKIFSEECFIKKGVLFENALVVMNWNPLPDIPIRATLYPKNGILTQYPELSEQDFIDRFLMNLQKFENIIDTIKRK